MEDTCVFINQDLHLASVHQDSSVDNSFVDENHNLYFRGRLIWVDY